MKMFDNKKGAEHGVDGLLGFFIGVFILILLASILMIAFKPMVVNNAYQVSQDQTYTIQNGTSTYTVTVAGSHDPNTAISLYNTMQIIVGIVGILVLLAGSVYYFVKMIKHG